MAVCPKCGIELPEGVKFCPACGAPVASADINEKIEDIKEKVEDTIDDLKEKAEEVKDKLEDKFDDFKDKAEDVIEDAKVKAAEVRDEIKVKVDEAKAAADAEIGEVYTPEDISNNKIMAALSYIGILVILPLLLAKDSRFAQFHANQGLLLLIVDVLLSVLSFIPVVKFFAGIIGLVVFVFCIIGIVAALKGEAKELPVIGKYRILK